MEIFQGVQNAPFSMSLVKYFRDLLVLLGIEAFTKFGDFLT